MNVKLVATRGDRTRTRSVLTALTALAVLAIAVVPASAGAATKTKTTPVPVLAQGVGMGAKPSTAVRGVQRVLKRHGYDLGAPAGDGVVGPKTRKLVRLIQKRSQQASTSRGQTGKHKATTKPGTTRQPSAEPASQTRTTVLPSQSDDTGWLFAIAASAAFGMLAAAFA